ncbi:hypothetical protein LAZ67_12001177 [Cordylochernes scorpioides]|uniref:Uncharacterized protein n=1 Tax=Cordylochernes scorpioides TaxID=51811 RepID=A0ABY6L114_9ARAC|nr:hypothetical protein LAZ67_12001177 [Cordylochernes scorpioides]
MKKISQLKEDIHRSHLKISLAIVLDLKTDDTGLTVYSLMFSYDIIAPGCGLADSSAMILSCAGSCILPERVSTILQIYIRE